MSKGNFLNRFRENRNAKGQEASTIRKIVFIVLFLVTIALVVAVFWGYSFVKSGLEPVASESEETVDIEIPIGSSTSTIASILEENNIINSALIFRFYISFKNESGFQAGEYTFSPTMTLDEIIESLKSGKIVLEPTHRVTVPEGLTVEQIAEIFSGKFSFTSEDFVEIANDEDYLNDLISRYPNILSEDILHEDIRTPLEGYLFGITYDIYEEDPSIESIIEMMLDQTNSVVTGYLDTIANRDFTVHEALTFASIIEKESGANDQRQQIAGVFYNRLEQGMRLQTDPTVLYAHGEHKDRVLYEDLEIESPYNTYYIEGLPIGPISNFGMSSFEAVINPANNNYFYFLHDSAGNIYYAETLDEHNQNIQTYR
ncbi:endolytic transglycosylase MltG [Oceanobacillus sp. CAU 1775]